MTAAMSARVASLEPKVLRVGVLHGTRMSEEKVLRARVPVTLGTTEQNTFTVVDTALPARMELFSVVNGQYQLNVTDAMEGRVALGDRVCALDALPDATRTAAGRSVALSESSRGRIQIGALTVLFQFVNAPPVQPKPQLPATLRARLGNSLDWTYNGCLAFFAALAITSAGYAELVYDPIVDVDALEQARLVRLLTQPPAEVTEPADAPPTDAPDTAAAAAAPSSAPSHMPSHASSHTPSRTPTQGPSDRQIAAAMHAADVTSDAANRALSHSAAFDALTASVTNNPNSARDALHNGGLMAGTERELQGLQGVHAGGPTVSRTLAAAGPRGTQLGEHTAVHAAGDEIRTGEITHERVLHPTTDLGPSEVLREDGDIDAGAVARMVRGQLGGIRSCYERALRNHPTLSGRLDARFTIGVTGRITTIASRGLTEAPEVSTCVNTRLRGLVFPTPQGGAVEFSFPFTFTPGG